MTRLERTSGTRLRIHVISFVALQLLHGAGVHASDSAIDQETQSQRISRLAVAVSQNYAAGNFQAAEAEARQLVDLQAGLLGPLDSRTIAVKSNLAELHRLMGHYSEAEGVYADVLPSIRNRGRELSETPEAALILCNIGLLRSDRGDYENAEESLREASEILSRTVGEAHPKYAHALNCLGMVKRNQGDIPTAMRLFEQAERIAGDDMAFVAQVQNNLADLHHTAGNKPQAEECYMKCIMLLRKQLGSQHPQVALAMHNLAVLHRDHLNYVESAKLERQACKIIRSACGDQHPYHAMCLGSLAETELRQGEVASARTKSIKATEILQPAVGATHPLYAANLRVRAEVCVAEGNLSDAEAMLLEAERVQSQVSNHGHGMQSIRKSLQRLYSMQGKPAEVSRLEALLNPRAEDSIRDLSRSKSNDLRTSE